MEIAPQIQKNQCDYDLMSDYMFSATMGLNNFIRMGVTGDWFTHNIGEQITALHGITHGETLTMIYPGTIEYLREQKKGKLLQFGERVLKITEGSDNERIDAVIAKIEAFFKSLGLATRLSEKQIGLETIEEITRRLNARGIKFGEKKNLTGDDARQIMLLRL